MRPLKSMTTALLVSLSSITICCSSSPDPADEQVEVTEEVSQEQLHADELRQLLESAEQTFQQRQGPDDLHDAIETWERALENPVLSNDAEAHSEVLTALSRAHFLLGKYYGGTTPMDSEASGQTLADLARGSDYGLQAVALRAPEFHRAILRGAPFEDDLPAPPDRALEPLLWYGQNLFLLSRFSGVTEQQETLPLTDVIMEAVTETAPELDHGAAHRYFGWRWVDRPFHRDPDQSAEAFSAAIGQAPDFSLNHVAKAHHLARFQGDRALFAESLDAALSSQALSPEDEVARQWARQLADTADEIFD